MIKNILFLFTFLFPPGFLFAQNVPHANFKASDTAVCGDVLTDNFTDLSTNNPTSWKWYFPGATPDTSALRNPANIVYNGYGCYDVTEVVKNNNGSDSITRRNYVCLDTLPKIKITESGLCQGGNGEDTIIITGGDSTLYYYINAVVNMTFTVQVHKGACYKDTSFTIKVDTMPATFFKGDTSICVGDSTIIYLLPAVGHSQYGYTYLWSTGSTADSIVVSADTPGSYTYYVTVSKGACSKDSAQITVKVHDCTGIDNFIAYSGFHIFPNPAGNELFFKIPCLYNQDAILTITDVTGRIVKREMLQAIQPDMAIPVSDLAPAMYFLRIQSDEGLFVQKFVKD